MKPLKATNSESAAVHYFEKTDLIQTLLDSLNLENSHCQTLIGQGIKFMSNPSESCIKIPIDAQAP